jgi:hypothetical protein
VFRYKNLLPFSQQFSARPSSKFVVSALFWKERYHFSFPEFAPKVSNNSVHRNDRNCALAAAIYLRATDTIIPSRSAVQTAECTRHILSAA